MNPKNPDISAEEVRTAFKYDADTGKFTRDGKAVGFVHHTGYVNIKFRCKHVLAHRLAWIYTHGRWPAYFIDHINGDKLDNRICNLREATHGQNAANSKMRAQSGFKGVYPDRRGTNHYWNVAIQLNGKKTAIGTFKNLEDAVRAYREAAVEAYGEFARF